MIFQSFQKETVQITLAWNGAWIWDPSWPGFETHHPDPQRWQDWLNRTSIVWYMQMTTRRWQHIYIYIYIYMSDLKYCVPKSETKLFLYGFSTDSLRICGRFAHNICMPQKTNPKLGHGAASRMWDRFTATKQTVGHEKRHSEPRSLLLSNCSTDSLRILYGSDG